MTWALLFKREGMNNYSNILSARKYSLFLLRVLTAGALLESLAIP